MGWRTVYIQSSSKISLNLDNIQVVHRNQKYFIGLDEIDSIIIEDNRTLVTVKLLSKLCEFGINLIVCEDNKMPIGALHSFKNNARTAKYSKNQLEISKVRQKKLWKVVIECKISNQINTLKMLNKKCSVLTKYKNDVKAGDITNREGLAAREYFKVLFDEHFKRFEDDIINFSLNYIYQVLRSKIAQIIIDKGFHPSFGLFHKGEYNYFNLADDLIEVFRPIADYYIVLILEEHDKTFLTPLYKEAIIEFLNYKVEINNQQMKIIDSIKVYVNHIFNYYTDEDYQMKVFPKIYEQ